MSLAMYASEFNNDENNNYIQKKKECTRNKTLKRKDYSRTNNKVNNMIQQMSDNNKNINNENNIDTDTDTDNDNDNMFSDYQPLNRPSSSGIERMEHGMQDRIDTQQNNVKISPPQQEAFTQLPSEYAKQYYQQYVPYFNQSSDDNTPNGVNKDELLNKLNQVIYLLEEQQEEQSGHVTEELILYSFLGIFMIFIVDSFARVGKYVR
jgi:hypothetical protein